MTADRIIHEVTARARRQHGLIRTDQIPDRHRDRFRHLARRGMLERVAKGVYRTAGAPRTWEQDLQAGVWSLGTTSDRLPGAVSRAGSAVRRRDTAWAAWEMGGQAPT